MGRTKNPATVAATRDIAIVRFDAALCRASSSTARRGFAMVGLDTTAAIRLPIRDFNLTTKETCK